MQTRPQARALNHFGKHLGIAFQLMDDLLDYDGTTCDLGKNIGDDLAEGKMTLPLIVALTTRLRARCRVDPIRC